MKVFIVCLIAVIRHQRQNKKPVQKPVQTMERIQVADIEHSHLKAISSPNILLPHSSSRSSRRPSKSSPPSPLPTSIEILGALEQPLVAKSAASVDDIGEGIDESEEITLLPQPVETPRLV